MSAVGAFLQCVCGLLALEWSFKDRSKPMAAETETLIEKAQAGDRVALERVLLMHSMCSGATREKRLAMTTCCPHIPS